MKRRIGSVVSSMAIVLLFAAIWLITGCEQENSPVASEQELLMAPRNGNGNDDPHPEGDDEGDSNAGGKGKNKGKGNPHTSSNITGNPHTASNPTGDPHIDDVVPGINSKPEKPGKNKEKSEKSKNDDPPEESIKLTGTVASIEGNDIILEDGVVVHTSPKSYSNDEGWYFKDDDNNGNNDLLEALIGLEITVVGEPIYDELTGKLIAIDAYSIKGIISSSSRDPGKPPWAGPKPKD